MEEEFKYYSPPRYYKKLHLFLVNINPWVEPNTWSHLFDCVLVDKMMVMFVQGAVQRYTITFKQQILNKSQQLVRVMYFH